MNTNEIKLTQYSHGAGCGCKISPAVLENILHSENPIQQDARLLVGNDKKDDAAVYDLGNGTALISTTDFFMPIVDNSYDFGRVAAANAISDVYAMGGAPILSIAILGWPIKQLPPEVAQAVMEGARSICQEAGISLAGGHSIDSPEPIFGLAVNGIVPIAELKKNAGALPGCSLYLTKPIGIGALSTAQKKGLLSSEDAALMLKSMTTLNNLGSTFAKWDAVKAMTDVTGFGLLGHVTEMCEASNVRAELTFDNVPVIPSLSRYLDQNCIPGGTNRNWASYGEKIGPISERQKQILADPQTSGGLLVAVEEGHEKEMEAFLNQHNLPAVAFGKMHPKTDGKPLISVN